MKNSVTVWFKYDDVLEIDFQKDSNDMVTLYWGNIEIYIHIDEMKHLAKRIDKFLKEK